MDKPKSISLIFSMLLFFLASCVDDLTGDKIEDNGENISFRVSIADMYQSKGTPVNHVSDTAFKNIGILGYHTEKKFSDESNPSSSFFPDIVATKNTNNTWSLNSTYYWPQSGYLSIFAYSPYASEKNGIHLDKIQNKTPQLTYQVPHEVSNQPDLMVATPALDQYKQIIPLNFSHALACIGFDVSGENVPIDSIGIKGIYTTGNLSLNLVDNLPEWKNLAGENDDFYKVGLIENPEATNPEQDIMMKNGYLMMIPQQIQEEACIIIKFKGMDPKTIPLKNAGTKEWIAGKRYIYSLKEGIYDFDITSGSNSCEYSGGEIDLNIKSTYTTQNGLSQEMGWKAEIISSTSEDSYWTNSFKNLSDLNGTETNKKIVINPALYTTDSRDDLALKKADSISYSNIKDLSKVNNTYSTANTYIVNNPGWHKFPCWVMGNAIANNSTNSINNSGCISETAPLFKNYAGVEIKNVSDLEIDVSNTVPELIWSDAPGLVSNIKLSEDRKYIEFYVSPNTIRQGNAIVAIKKGGQVIWSWQIWVTTWKLNTGNQVIGNGNPDIMPFAVGRCSAAEYKYLPNQITIRFTQNISNRTKEITLVQNGETINLGENAPFYQWGRKDPMLSSNGMGKAESKNCFGNKIFKRSSSTTPVSITDGILNPNIFYCSDGFPGNWQTPVNINLWGNAQTENTIWKSIYDPCPIGYQVPQLSTIFAFVDMTYQFVEEPINGCEFSPLQNNVYSVFLAANGGRGNKDGSLFGTIPPDKGGYYWSNSNYYWETNTEGSKNTFLNLIFSLKRDNSHVYYQVNPSASALNVVGSVQ
ncbi:MAG: fimbrillin family protein [Bacteroidales bacterium]